MSDLVFRPMASDELHRLDEIDRTERIESIYVQHGETLEETPHIFGVREAQPGRQ